ncbi:unnamed protein product [Rotaria sordida]|uniref:Uncharacterized protein n=1 Tax=Rotaria sordida TaxID=392033 RepID=A0A818NZQ7_9BILA|nr:unnamed protein product [Rotaria sordida]CAF3574262.1 unnamed protein product [Rotaria sordida]CAF3614363.1 unnamed protein product [Rotaria sordida]
MIVDMEDKKSDCWKCFGVLAYCYTTYSYSSSTRNMNKHIRICSGFNSSQTHFITSTETNYLQLINTSTSSSLISSSSSSSNNKSLESHKKK